MAQTENFNHQTDKMIPCPCCGKGELESVLVVVLEYIRKDLGPLKINSGCRCPNYQRELYKRLSEEAGYEMKPPMNGDHVLDSEGMARGVDVPNPKGMNSTMFYNYVNSLPFANLLALGRYSWGLHIGVRGYKARW